MKDKEAPALGRRIGKVLLKSGFIGMLLADCMLCGGGGMILCVSMRMNCELRAEWRKEWKCY